MNRFLVVFGLCCSAFLLSSCYPSPCCTPSCSSCAAPGPSGCPLGETNCGTYCSNTQFDPLNCGGCGAVCNVPGGEICFNGACVPFGSVDAGAGTDAGMSTMDAGVPDAGAMSDAGIDSGAASDAGSCSPSTCSDTCCGNECVDLDDGVNLGDGMSANNSVNHCGSCGNVCSGNANFCMGGGCWCGSFGNTCPVGWTCTAPVGGGFPSCVPPADGGMSTMDAGVSDSGVSLVDAGLSDAGF